MAEPRLEFVNYQLKAVYKLGPRKTEIKFSNYATYIGGVVFKPLVDGTLEGGRHYHIVLTTAVDGTANI